MVVMAFLDPVEQKIQLTSARRLKTQADIAGGYGLASLSFKTQQICESDPFFRRLRNVDKFDPALLKQFLDDNHVGLPATGWPRQQTTS